jgi:phospholipid-binding lipoprotein MlaA
VKALNQFKHSASLCLAVIVLTGCASGPNRHPEDPLEPLNREIYSFNRGLDMFIFAPVAGIYHKLVPSAIRACVTNFFSNIDDITVAANEVLQLKIPDAIQTSTRFVLNTTLGVGGIFDVASTKGIYKRREDFGTTLAHYGMKSSPYIVLPIIGPSTVRDGTSLIIDWYLTPYAYVDDWIMWYALGINLVNLRANMLEEVGFVNYAAQDSYSFVRDIYLQRRKAMINGTELNSEWNEGGWNDWDDAAGKKATPANPAPLQGPGEAWRVPDL